LGRVGIGGKGSRGVVGKGQARGEEEIGRRGKWKGNGGKGKRERGKGRSVAANKNLRLHP